jgi:hypothetical protein
MIMRFVVLVTSVTFGDMLERRTGVFSSLAYTSRFFLKLLGRPERVLI